MMAEIGVQHRIRRDDPVPKYLHGFSPLESVEQDVDEEWQ